MTPEKKDRPTPAQLKELMKDMSEEERLKNALQFTKSFKRLARLRKHKEDNKNE
tara:strand:+ start:406 stop:567 length:162 start_codon:yes stop_codon:yes gene_type:complete